MSELQGTFEYPFNLNAFINDTSHSGASYVRKQMANWTPSRLPADVDLLPDLATLVARGRDLNRNNGVAAASLQTLQDNVAGTGLRLAASPDFRALGKTIEWADQWSRRVESLWRTWSETTACDISGKLTFSQMTQLVFRSGIENGESLALSMWLERKNTPWRTCMQLVESDRLSNPWGEVAGRNTGSVVGLPVEGRNVLVAGIEKDVYGRPVAYYIRKSAPWMDGWAIYQPYVSSDWERIPAETEFGRKLVLHMHSVERVGQSRGRPLLTPVMEQFRMLDAYQRTELQSAIVNALVAATIETPMDQQAITELVGGDPNKYLTEKSEYRPQLEGGTLIPLYPGDKLSPFLPSRPSGQFAPFIEALSRQIGAAMGLPYELALKDFSKTNYSSARAALMEAWRFFTVRRKWLAENWAAPVYELWLEEAVNMGLVEAPGYYQNQTFYARSRWIGMGKGWIDPVKEATASQLRMDSMISTLEIECAEQGLDWNEVLEQRALENARMEQLGLHPPVAAAAAAPGAPAKPGAPAPEEEEEPVPA